MDLPLSAEDAEKVANLAEEASEIIEEQSTWIDAFNADTDRINACAAILTACGEFRGEFDLLPECIVRAVLTIAGEDYASRTPGHDSFATEN